MTGCTTDWSNVTLAAFNQTLLNDTSLCTKCTCPLVLDGEQLSWVRYYPNLAGNVLYTAIFGVFLVLQLFFGISRKTRGYMIAMLLGLILEVLGYIGRILLRYSMFSFSWFLMYLVCLTLAPAFFSAAIYLTLSRLITIYGAEYARFRPQVYTYIFITFDIIALILQAAGGAIASIASAYSSEQSAGVHTMVGGLAWQVVSLFLFACLSLDFYLRVRRSTRNGLPLNPAFDSLRAQRSFEPWFMISLCLAGLFIFVRSVFRCAELQGGFGGKLANEEIPFMVLEGAMMVLACGLLTLFHPGFVFGARDWALAKWKRGAKGQ
ncbi:RTA1-domain-containing protein [Aspergillus heteromorphus CBS 117.55]|uniref:RTA1-domain-containing protein n=1 Tax=Aspergillus heteromorphus CBS 117.55 TaxID=1448321 RepID=A0A317WB65_9EURO|nr:RTA1-domain-containing protein [Aspergillus heteromorphus CBS 117.55]PWY83583.1 RTA1-domain-containing protein [Aspergillus heteromorphus CBS 117.55]